MTYDPNSPAEIRARAMADARRAEREAKRAAERASQPDPVAKVSDHGPDLDEPCPDPSAPDAAAQLYGALYRRMWRLAMRAASTNQDIVSAFSVARLAAGVGKVAPPPKEYRLPMASLLPPQGASDAKPTGGDA